jgi:SAM-dependent methyltransferase
MLSIDQESITHYASKTGLPHEVLEGMFRSESVFHNEILKEKDFDKRTALYEHIYTQSANATAPYLKEYFKEIVEAKRLIFNIFKHDFVGKSIIDIGCGSGGFLYFIAKSGYSHKALYGLDVKTPTFPKDEFSNKIECQQSSIIKFSVPFKFEAAMLDNVYEHIAPADKGHFLNSVSDSLQIGGKLILIIPSRLFGPADWTLLADRTFSGSIEAQCLHLDETTFKETISNLKRYGFGNFKSPIPFVALNPIKQIVPNFRLPSSFYAFLEDSWFMKLCKKIHFRGKSLFRMEVIIVAEKIK